MTRALALAGRSVGVEVEVDKRIPAGAGLGGGSSDAAAVLRWAGIRRPRERAAFELGADVAFCLIGGPGAGHRYRRDRRAPLTYEERLVTLLTPPVHCPTGAVYRAWDELQRRVRVNRRPPNDHWPTRL